MWVRRGLFGVPGDQCACENFITMDVVEIDSVASKTPHKCGISKRNPRSHNYMQLQFCSGTQKSSIFQKKILLHKKFFFAPLCSKNFFCPNLSFRHIFRCFGPKKIYTFISALHQQNTSIVDPLLKGDGEFSVPLTML